MVSWRRASRSRIDQAAEVGATRNTPDLAGCTASPAEPSGPMTILGHARGQSGPWSDVPSPWRRRGPRRVGYRASRRNTRGELAATGFPSWTSSTGPVLAFAHRGGAPPRLGPENTCRVRPRRRLGYRYLETDVHLTRDGVLVAFHDALLDRVTDGVGRDRGPRPAATSPRSGSRAEPVPTLAELVDGVPGRPLQHRPQGRRRGRAAGRASSASAACRTGSWSGRSRGAGCAGSGAWPAARVATSASPAEVAAYVLPAGRLARPADPGGSTALQVPHRPAGSRRHSPRLVRRAHAAGLQVHVWTVDDPDEMRVLLDRGVDGLMTDRTDILGDVLRERGPWTAAP